MHFQIFETLQKTQIVPYKLDARVQIDWANRILLKM